ncbi:MAG: hypothetical protein ACKOXP_10165 [Flavobacteriales bacterium]
MNRFIEIIKYSWKAKGRHGIHSPFVYELVDQCFQLNISKSLQKHLSSELKIQLSTAKCIYQLLQQLDLNCLVSSKTLTNDRISDLFGETNLAFHSIHSHFTPHLTDSKNTLAVISMEDIESNGFEFLIHFIESLKEDTIIVVDNIRRDSTSFDLWNQLISMEQIHFSADLFNFGLLAKRTFQEKEHFILRY